MRNHGMKIKTKTPLIILLILTMFSAGLLGYTLYHALMIRWAMKSIEVTVRDVNVTFNDQPRINFKVVFKNNVNTYLGISYISVNVYLNNTKVNYKSIERGYSNPVVLPSNVDKVLEFSTDITIPADYSGKWLWKFRIYAIFSTSLIQQSSVDCWVSYEG
jgi:hypothetical protein